MLFAALTSTILKRTFATTCSVMSSAVVSHSALPRSGPYPTPDPFLFCVYHKDAYPAGNANMEAPRRGNGADFDPSAPYRMYHGNRIPGFPQHPHRGFETITATIEGLIDHTDSCGNGGRYGQGDLQWMTAGGGVVHGEMFPLINSDKPNHTRFFQIWLNLPKKNKMVPADFAMHWAEQIPRVTTEDGSAITIWAGEYGGHKALPPPVNSYAADANANIGVYHITVPPGGRFVLPAVSATKKVNRNAYHIEGTALHINGQPYPAQHALTLNASINAEISNPSSTPCEVLILQGAPLNEPVVQHGPFVMNSEEEIREAFADYRRTQFGGWPWDMDAMVFARDKGRFSLLNGVESRPPAAPVDK